MSEGCAYQFGPLLVNLSDRWDYLNEFEWSIRRMLVENMAERIKQTKTTLREVQVLIFVLISMPLNF